MKIGIIREGKVPPDLRVALSPKQCKALLTLYPHVRLVVEESPIRTFSDQSYRDEGIEVVSHVADCDMLLGIKEVPKDQLIAQKTYLFFSHTIKKQPYNRELLRTILDKKITLIDYEVIRDKHRNRLIGFGRYAGIVGAYNAFLTYGLKHGTFNLKPANLCENRDEVERELKKVVLPPTFRCLVTGFGRVGHGAKEIIDLLPITEVSPEEFLTGTFSEPIFCQLEASDYFEHPDHPFDKPSFYSDPSGYQSTLVSYAEQADLYMPCHYWDNRSPKLLTQADLQRCQRLQVIADISCDVNGPIASTVRASSIADPIYGYDPTTGAVCDYRLPGAIAVMAVDNLPCELPKDASEDFGAELLKHVFPRLFGEDPDRIIHYATETTQEGELNEPFEYLKDYVEGN
jgi:hypothetical protein